MQQRIRVRNFDRYQTRDEKRKDTKTTRHFWLKLSVDTFRDERIGELEGIQQLGWIAVLIAAKMTNNRVPTDPRMIAKLACINGRVNAIINIEKMVALGLIEFFDVEDPPEQPPAASQEKPAKKRGPAGIAKTRDELAAVDTPENRQGLEDLNSILSRSLHPTVTNLGFFARLRAGGYTREQWVSVLTAVRDKVGSTAQWAAGLDDVPLAYILRPGEDGGFDKILNQAAESAPKAARVESAVETAEQRAARKAREEAAFNDKYRGVEL